MEGVMNTEFAIFTAVFTLLGVSLMMRPRSNSGRPAPRRLPPSAAARHPRARLLFSPIPAPVARC
jgi:hypothetical protein